MPVRNVSEIAWDVKLAGKLIISEYGCKSFPTYIFPFIAIVTKNNNKNMTTEGKYQYLNQIAPH